MSVRRPAIGWVGLGAIGLPMALRAKQARFSVCAWDPSPRRQEAALEAGIDLAAGAAEVGRRAERVVICVVRSAAESAEALLGPGGALAAGERIGVVMSSIGAGAMGELLERAGVETCLLDAPILGNPRLAEEGALTIPVAGEPAAIAVARPILESFASAVIDLGPEAGTAQAVKAVSQQLQILGMLAGIEGMSLARASGVGQAEMLEILNATEPTWTTRNWEYASELWRAGEERTSLGLFRKDLAAALGDAAGHEVEMPLTARGLALLEQKLKSNEAAGP